MKAERRHELQTNSLALWMQIRLPELWQKYGNHILLGLIVLVGAFWFVRWRIEAPKKAAAQAGQALAVVDQKVNDLRRMQRQAGDVSDVPQSIADALDTSDNKDIQALAWTLLGEYRWTMASLPSELTSRPAQSSPEDLYKQADEAFRKALAAGGQQMDVVARAHAGRALVAEQQAFESARKDNFKTDPARNPFWQTARAEYEAIANDPNMLQTLRDEAKAKIEILGKMQKPVWIAKIAPTTLPLGPLGPEMPESRPSAPIAPTPAIPTTRPANRKQAM
ncbi:MAG: hypothetical protein ABSH20_13815 [Tepidisphaeraceae bacterium]|jgi:hypothetical protein